MKQQINELLNYECKALGLQLSGNQEELQKRVYEKLNQVVTHFGLVDDERMAYLSELSEELILRDTEYLSVAYLRIEFFAYWLKKELDRKVKWGFEDRGIPSLSELSSIYELATILHTAEEELTHEETLM